MAINEDLQANKNEENDKGENILRPLFLDDFLGQEKLKENLKIFDWSHVEAEGSDTRMAFAKKENLTEAMGWFNEVIKTYR